MTDLQVTDRPIDSLKPYTRNARSHSKRQIRQIADSITRFGWTNPVLVDGDGGIIAGHARVEAAIHLGLKEVPTIRIEDLTEAEKCAYIIADNRLAELAGWDTDILAGELQFLASVDCDIDVQITGFEMAEVDLLIQSLEKPAGQAEDDLLEVSATTPAVSVTGDLWLLGDHRLLCGDARDGEAYQRLMDGELARLVFTDPPYNVRVDGHVSGLGKTTHREFAMASGEMTEAEFTAFLQTVLTNMADVSCDGALHFIAMDWRHLFELLTAGRAVYDELKNMCVWAKSNAGMGSLYRSQHEEVLVFKTGKAPHVNNVLLGRFGRNRTNLWRYQGVNSFRSGRMEELSMHPTVKPLDLVADVLQDCSNRGDVVLDPFCGSGTTIIAAEKTGRRAHCLEIDPLYVDAALQRWEKVSGAAARHAESGRSFEVTRQLRHTEMTLQPLPPDRPIPTLPITEDPVDAT
jgi:DNA modification methylase